MKVKIYYTKGSEQVSFTLEEPGRSFRGWVNDLGVSVGTGGLFCGNNFAFPARSIYYIEALED